MIFVQTYICTEFKKLTEVLHKLPSYTSGETATGEYNNNHEENAMDLGGVWPLMCQSLGDPYKDLAWLPRWVDSTVIEPCDWKH